MRTREFWAGQKPQHAGPDVTLRSVSSVLFGESPPLQGTIIPTISSGTMTLLDLCICFKFECLIVFDILTQNKVT